MRIIKWLWLGVFLYGLLAPLWMWLMKIEYWQIGFISTGLHVWFIRMILSKWWWTQIMRMIIAKELKNGIRKK